MHRRRRGAATSCVLLVPSTRFCEPPRKTLSEPLASGTVVTCTSSDRLLMVASRWSSRSFGVWPVPLLAAMLPLREAMRAVSELIEATEVRRSLEMPVCSVSIWSLAVRKAAASSPTRASATCRAEESCGLLATSTKAL